MIQFENMFIRNHFFDLQKKAHISLEETKNRLPNRSQVDWEILM